MTSRLFAGFDSMPILAMLLLCDLRTFAIVTLHEKTQTQAARPVLGFSVRIAPGKLLNRL
jgi:hypothetical protein